jgi:hypothetical protein
VLKASKAGVPFNLYISTQEKVIDAVLIQEHGGKESVVSYLRRRLHEQREQVCVY